MDACLGSLVKENPRATNLYEISVRIAISAAPFLTIIAAFLPRHLSNGSQ
jgi:hypothetical protein